MRYNEKVEFLEGYSRCLARIQAFQAEYERWETIGEKITQSYSPTPGSSSGNDSKVARAALEMAEISKNIEIEIGEAVLNRDAIKVAISKAKRLRDADILTYRYISCLKNWQIANILRKEPQTISKAIKSAIIRLEI